MKNIIFMIVVIVLTFVAGYCFSAWYTEEYIVNTCYDSATQTLRIVGQ